MSTAPSYSPPSGWSPGPPPVPARPPLDAWSVVSLATALLGLVLVGLVAGVVGLARTAGGRRRGGGLAVAGLVVSVLVLLAQVGLVLAVGPSFVAGVRDGLREATGTSGGPAGEAEATEAGAPSDQGPDDAQPADDGSGVVMIDSYDLDVGHCFDDPSGETFLEIATLPCDRPHDGEVVAVVELGGTRYPGATAVDDQGWDACSTAAADAFDAAGVDGSALELWTFTPTKESWVLDGDRSVVCLAYGLDGKLTEPVLP